MAEVKVIDRPAREESEQPLPPLPRLEEWARCEVHYRSPCLEGFVYGHPLIRDGEYVWTSRLLWINEESRLAQTASRLYSLGKKAR